MKKVDIPQRAIIGLQVIEHYGSISDQPFENNSEAMAMIIRDFCHYAMCSGISPAELIAIPQAGVMAASIEVTSVRDEITIEEARADFRARVEKVRNPTVPAGFEKFMPGAQQ